MVQGFHATTPWTAAASGMDVVLTSVSCVPPKRGKLPIFQAPSRPLVIHPIHLCKQRTHSKRLAKRIWTLKASQNGRTTPTAVLSPGRTVHQRQGTALLVISPS